MFIWRKSWAELVVPEALVSSSWLGAKFVASTQDLFTSEQVVIRGRIVNRPNVMYVSICTRVLLCKWEYFMQMHWLLIYVSKFISVFLHVPTHVHALTNMWNKNMILNHLPLKKFQLHISHRTSCGLYDIQRGNKESQLMPWEIYQTLLNTDKTAYYNLLIKMFVRFNSVLNGIWYAWGHTIEFLNSI